VTQHATARRKIVGAAAAALALAGLLAGCTSKPGAAAIVDGRAIPTSDIVTVQDELRPAVGDVTTQQVLNILIQEPTVVQVASEHGDGVSDADAKATLDGFFTTNNLTPPASYAPATMQVGLHQAAGQKLQADANSAAIGQEFNDQLAKVKVTVNPRFGTWDASQGQVAASTTPSWMVTPK
jgi:hypothetical protein